MPFGSKAVCVDAFAVLSIISHYVKLHNYKLVAEGNNLDLDIGLNCQPLYCLNHSDSGWFYFLVSLQSYFD